MLSQGAVFQSPDMPSLANHLDFRAKWYFLGAKRPREITYWPYEYLDERSPKRLSFGFCCLFLECILKCRNNCISLWCMFFKRYLSWRARRLALALECLPPAFASGSSCPTSLSWADSSTTSKYWKKSLFIHFFQESMHKIWSASIWGWKCNFPPF